MTTIYQNQGTDITWKASGGTHVLTLTSLASNAGRKSDLHDFGTNIPQNARVELKTKIAVAPALGKTIDVYWACSVDNSSFDAQLAAGDAALSDVTTINQLRFVGSLSLLANTNLQSQSWDFAIPARYGFLVLINNSGQALSSTSADHILTITPLLGTIV